MDEGCRESVLESQEEEREAGGKRKHASVNPWMGSVDERTGNNRMRLVDQKGLGEDGDQTRLIKHMRQESKSWGHEVDGGS